MGLDVITLVPAPHRNKKDMKVVVTLDNLKTAISLADRTDNGRFGAYLLVFILDSKIPIKNINPTPYYTEVPQGL